MTWEALFSREVITGYGLTPHHEHAAFPNPYPCKQRIEHRAFTAPTPQRHSMLTHETRPDHWATDIAPSAAGRPGLPTTYVAPTWPPRERLVIGG
jgi:hypothetical protein